MISKKRAAISLAAIALAASGIAYLPDVYKEHKAKQAVRERLKDPSSAVFERLEVHKAGVCGFVNAKNEMGGYVGHKAFFTPMMLMLNSRQRITTRQPLGAFHFMSRKYDWRR